MSRNAEIGWRDKILETLCDSDVVNPDKKKAYPTSFPVSDLPCFIIGRDVFVVAFSSDWAECIGTALFASTQSGCRPCCILLINGYSDAAAIMACQETGKRNAPTIDVSLFDIRTRRLEMGHRKVIEIL